jgi:aryl-alcohol dehydrogenase-like predicted oxidoreductase
MRARTLGSSGLAVSVVGLGTWAMGGGGWVGSWGPQDDGESVAAIRRGLELGANWLDTAPIYGFGHAEEVVGRALDGASVRPLVATKLSRAWDEHGKVSGNLKRAHVRRSVEASLRRLRIERIDLYQVHWPDPDPDLEEGWTAIADLVREGKVAHAGVCNVRVAQLERIGPIHPVVSVQMPYSLLNRAAEGVLAYCCQHGIGVVTYSPMEQGLLAGRFTKDRVAGLHGEDHRRREAQFQEPALSSNLVLVDGLRDIAARSGRPVGQLAVAWVLQHPAVTSAIVGARRPSQIEETLPAESWRLTEVDRQAIDLLLQQRQEQLAVH